MYEKTYKVSGKKVGDLGVEVTARGHKIKVDEPIEGGGEDTGMNPVEMLLGSIAACQTISTSIYAESMGIKIDEMSIEVEGRHGFSRIYGICKIQTRLYKYPFTHQN